jgi:hypothetical protein
LKIALLALLLSATGQKVGTPSEYDVSARKAKATGASTSRTLAEHLATLPDAQVTAQGSTTARSLAARAADVINVQDFGAVGYATRDAALAGVDSTGAIQAAIDRAGHWTYTNPYRVLMNSGGGIVYVPKGVYKVTAGLLVGGGVTIRGDGPGTMFIFRPAAPSTFLKPDPAKATADGTTFTDIHLHDFQVFGGGSPNNGYNGIFLQDCSYSTVARVTVANFTNYGVYFGTSGAGASYYNKTEKLNLYDNAVNLYLDTLASAHVDVGSTLYHLADYAAADYTAVVKDAAAAAFIGTKFQGRPNIAQVNDEGTGTAFIGNYAETQVGAGIPDKPFVRRATPTRGSAATTVVGAIKQKYLFSQWAETATEADYYTPQYPMTLHVGTPHFLPSLIQNPGKFGVYGYAAAGGAGSLAWDATKTFMNGRGSLKLTSAGTSYAVKYTIPGASLAKIVGRRLYVTFSWFTDSGATQVAHLQGAGNSHEKYSYNNGIDFGNGWQSKEMDIPILSATDLDVVLEVNGANGVSANFTDIFAWVDGFEWVPVDRDARIEATAAPATGTWAVGDRVAQLTPAVGQPKAWVCTVAGTPGTWVSEGNL